MVSPIITGLSETKNSDEPSILTRIIAFDEHHDHDVDKVCVMKDENIDVLSTIDDEITDNDAQEVPETSSLFDAQSHLLFNLSVTENEDDTSYDENGKFKDKNLKKYDGAISNFKGNINFLPSHKIEDSPQNVRPIQNSVIKTSNIDAEDQMTRVTTPEIEANLDHQNDFKASGAIPKIPKIRKSGIKLDSEAKNVGIGAKKSKAEAEKLPEKAVVNTLDTISKQIENGRGLISNLLDMPKLSLRQPPITGYMVKTAENEAFLDPTLSPKNSTENIGEVNIIQDQTNIDNIECENDQYLDQILSLDGQNITKKSAQLSIDPPGRELEWKRFSDLLTTGFLVRLPNPLSRREIQR